MSKQSMSTNIDSDDIPPSLNDLPELPSAELASLLTPTATPVHTMPSAVAAVPLPFALAFDDIVPGQKSPVETKCNESSLQNKNNEKVLAPSMNIRPHTKALVDFMRQVHLHQYTEDLIKQGYDDLNFLSSMPERELQAVASLVSMLPGHAAKFVALLTKRVYDVSSASPGLGLSKEAQKVPDAASSGSDTSYVVCIVDRSGSMRTMGNAVKTGFNEFLHEQKAFPGDCMATVVRFDHEVEVVHHGVNLSAIQDATEATFQPRGRTALHDAIGETISMVQSKLSTLASKPSRVMVLVLTDGEENASSKHSSADIMKTIGYCEKKLKWTFVFVGANQDAIATGTKIGFSAQSCLSYTSDITHQRRTWSNISSNISRQRSGGSSLWSPVERRTSLSSW